MSSPNITLRQTGQSATSPSPHKQTLSQRGLKAISPRPEKIRLAGIIPSTVAGQVRLYDELSSPLHKHAESPLSSKFLSSSIADLRTLTNQKSIEAQVKSPKFVRHTRVKTLTNDDTIERLTKNQASPQRNKLKIQLSTTEGGKPQDESPNKASVRSPLSVNTLAYRDQLKQDIESSPLMRVDHDAYYYDTIRHLDECGKCWAQAQKNHSSPFKLKCKMPKCSNYQRDYPQHKIVEQGPVIRNETYETLKPKGSVGLDTTMKSSFQPFKADYVKHPGAKATLGPENATFFGRTSYNSDFYNLGSSKAFIERFPQPKTAVEGVPLKGSSNYKTNFGNFFVSKGCVTRWPKQNIKSPFSGGIPFLSQTTSGDFFKPFKTSAAAQNDKDNQEYTSTESFPNQFQTTYTKDFNAQPEYKCPAKIFMENNLPPRLNHLRAEPQF